MLATASTSPEAPNPFAGLRTVAECVQACTIATEGQVQPTDPECLRDCLTQLPRRISSGEVGREAMAASAAGGLCPSCEGLGPLARLGCELGRLTCNLTLFAGIILLAALVIALVVLVTR